MHAIIAHATNEIRHVAKHAEERLKLLTRDQMLDLQHEASNLSQTSEGTERIAARLVLANIAALIDPTTPPTR